MTWDPMAIDEFAAFQRSSGAHVRKIRGTWWVEVRPFFFRPLFPFSEITPGLRNYPLQSVVGGVLHLVPAAAAANSCMNLFLYDQVREYSLDRLGAKARSTIKKGLRNFHAARITDLNSFTEEAYPVYRSFYDRTRYFYKSERTEKRSFLAWAKPLFDNPKIMVLGAYLEDRLCAVDISYQVEDVIIDDVFFSDTKSQRLQVTDFLVHTLREAASSSAARYIFRGFPCGKESLDQAKMERGCKIVRLPAYCRINPVALSIGKALMNSSYKKLAAVTSQEQ